MQPSPPPKKYDKLKALFFRKKSHRSANKLAKKLSAVGIVEELFEEGSAMLAERLVFSFTLYNGCHTSAYMWFHLLYQKGWPELEVRQFDDNLKPFR